MRKVKNMTYPKRIDGRKINETREIEAKAGVIKRADGSAMFRIGKTLAYAAVYGPRNLHPRFLQNPREGIIRVNYAMMPFSSKGERVRPGPSRKDRQSTLPAQPFVRSRAIPSSRSLCLASPGQAIRALQDG